MLFNEFTRFQVPAIVSKTCNHAITQLCKIFKDMLKFWSNERETGKTGTNFMYLSNFVIVFLVSHDFM